MSKNVQTGLQIKSLLYIGSKVILVCRAIGNAHFFEKKKKKTHAQKFF